MPPSLDQRKPILAGNLSEFSVEALMAAFSLGRQVVTIEVLDARGALDGRIVMKGGRVLSANAAGRSGVEAVQHLVASAVPAKFRVVRETSDTFARSPQLGTLAEVTGVPRKRPAVMPSAARRHTHVMEGSLSDFDVATILQVVSTGRQHTVMEIVTHRGTRVGSIQLKAGKVLRAEAGSLEGVAAVQHLLRAPSSFRFSVQRAVEPVGELPLVGAVDEVLMRAATEEPAPRLSGIHLAPTAAELDDGELDDEEPDPDEIETLIPVSSAYPDELAEIDEALGELDELEDEVTRVSAPRAAEPAPSAPLPAAGLPPVRVPAAGVPPTRVPPARVPPVRMTAIGMPIAPVPPARMPPAGMSTAGMIARMPAAPTPAAGVPVLDGRLSDFDLCSVLQVAGLSRQPTAVRILDDQRQPVGEARVQGGQLLAVSAQGERDLAALRLLLHAPRDFHFSVWREPHQPDPTQTPLGTVTELLQLATERMPIPSAEPAPAYHSQAPSLPAGPLQASTWRRALGAGLLLGAAAGVIATTGLLRDEPAAAPIAGVQAPAPSVQTPAANEAPRAAKPVEARPAAQPVQSAPAARAPTPPRVEPVPSAASAFRPAAERSRAEIASLQGALRMLGFGPGPIDGFPGPITRSAITSFQRVEGLPEDGELSPATEQRLLARIRGSRRSAD